MVDFYKFDIATTVTDALIDMFDMMLSMKLELADEKAALNKEESRIMGSVSLVGKVKGNITIEVNDEFSRIMTASMLGIEIDEIQGTDDVMDVISEACNIVGGNLKSKFCDVGLRCRISPPSFTSGNDFSVETLNIHRHERYAFSYQNHLVIVDVGVGVDESAEEEEEEKQELPQVIKPIDINKFNDFDIKNTLSESMTELFDMMPSMDLELSEKDSNSSLDGERIVGSVSFVGALMGSCNIYISEVFSRIMAATMLGIEIEELEGEDEVKDVVSETCNIIGGNLKSKFCDSDLTCEISPPSFTSGKNFIIESKNMMRYERYAFRCREENIFVEVGLTVDEEALPEKQKAGADDAENGMPSGSELSQDEIDNITSQFFSEGDQQHAVDSLIAVQETPPKKPAKKKAQPPVDDTAHETSPSQKPGKRAADTGAGKRNLDMILDIPVEITIELGRTSIFIEDLLKLCNGSVVEFSNLAGEPVDVLINQKLVAKGKIIVEDEKYGVRITETMNHLTGKSMI